MVYMIGLWMLPTVKKDKMCLQLTTMGYTYACVLLITPFPININSPLGTSHWLEYLEQVCMNFIHFENFLMCLNDIERYMIHKIKQYKDNSITVYICTVHDTCNFFIDNLLWPVIQKLLTRFFKLQYHSIFCLKSKCDALKSGK